ncbi:hypothetical protein J0B03_03615 [Alkalibacter rhizosphaerae]|uniref:Uncharacterized protein n=1 Tax=Alkalibacter rhizosphaerae TaxID=2815577 RepID=A0A974XI85_9FIRM|nr:hypothetical protein [Alkalibacter rhizosphaerae]QSX09170.1 hypothetical protein J0B03_03615 [Alkalibacter rhizosphaerae]
MDMFVVKSGKGYARFLKEDQVEWGIIAKATVFGDQNLCLEKMESFRMVAESQQVRMAKLKIEEEDWIKK